MRVREARFGEASEEQYVGWGSVMVVVSNGKPIWELLQPRCRLYVMQPEHRRCEGQ